MSERIEYEIWNAETKEWSEPTTDYDSFQDGNIIRTGGRTFEVVVSDDGIRQTEPCESPEED